MKIVIVNGSPRTDGITAKILRRMEQRYAEKNGVSVTFHDLSKMNLQYCRGCGTCFRTGACVLEDDLEKLAQQMANADGIILGSPTYTSGVSGEMKTCIDRAHWVIEQGLYRKHAGVVITNENYGATQAAKYLKDTLVLSGAYVSFVLRHKQAFAASPLLTDEASHRAEGLADRLEQDVLCKRVYIRQKWKHAVAFRVGIRPFVQRKGAEYQGVLDLWKTRLP